MTGRRKHRLRGIAAPVLPGEPLVIRFCRAFVDSLAMLLRGAFIVGALLLVHEFDRLAEGLSPPVTDVETLPVPAADAIEPPVPAAPEPPALTDRVRHYLNCTYEAYRRENYAECVEEPSGIYGAPEADPDDTGTLLRQLPVRFARRSPAIAPGHAIAACSDPLACTWLL